MTSRRELLRRPLLDTDTGRTQGDRLQARDLNGRRGGPSDRA